MNYSLLGWLSAVIIGLQIAPYIIRKAVPVGWQSRPFLKNTMKHLRKIHKPVGLLLLIVPPIHGYMALGGFRLHTGVVLAIPLMATVVLGACFFFLKKKALLVWHRRMALVSVVLFLVHYFMPSLLS